MRQDQGSVQIRSLAQGPSVPVQGHAAVLDVVDQADLPSHELGQPDRRGVGDAQIEGRVDLRRRIVR